jgi:iron complex outermembrane receptor protein
VNLGSRIGGNHFGKRRLRAYAGLLSGHAQGRFQRVATSFEYMKKNKNLALAGAWRGQRGSAWCRTRQRLTGSAALALAIAGLSGHALASGYDELASLSLEDLGNIRVVSVSKKPERLADAAASVYVITNDDIRRAGATSLPQALRLAPNLQVAQINAQNQAISARGFNSTTANKLLVLIDGRTVYTPLYSGVFWDAQDLLMEDVERIEVLSGPGGTLWGTNAVNGVINVITRPAKDTVGTLLSAGAGNREKALALRYGAALGNGGHYRVYGMHVDRDPTSTASGRLVHDRWDKSQAGFRADWTSASEKVTLQGDVYNGGLDQPTLPMRARAAGLNVLAKWEHTLDDSSSLLLSAFYDRTERDFPGSYGQVLDVVDLQLQRSLKPHGAHSVVWGASYRYGSEHMDNSSALAFLPAHLTQQWASLFAQDEVTLRENLRLTLGLRLEQNDYTGLEILPSARLAWKLPADRLLWGAVSRVVRAPSRIDRDFYAPAKPPYVLSGNSTFRSEVADVVELGYRAQPAAAISYSVTVFHAIYDHLRSLERRPGGPWVIGNLMAGSTSGVEAWGTYRVTPTWRLAAGLSATGDSLRLKPGSTDPNGVSGAGNDPAHAWQLRSSWDLAAGREFDATLRHVAALPAPSVPAYTALDLRYGWTLRRGMDISLTAQNLLSGKHAEFGDPATRSELAPAAFIRLRWKI